MGLRATVMKIKLEKLLDRLERQASEITKGQLALEKSEKESKQFFDWWQEEAALTKELKKKIKDLEELTLLVSEDSYDGPDDVDVERMQSTADHDPNAMSNG